MNIERQMQIVARQEDELVFPRFDEELAWTLGVQLRERAAQKQARVVIDIRRGDEILFYCKMPGCTPANADWARRKRNAVELLRRSSYAINLKNQTNEITIEEKMALPLRDYACHGGCFPICVENAGFIGTITVSGLPQVEDHQLIVDALAALLQKQVPSCE